MSVNIDAKYEQIYTSADEIAQIGKDMHAEIVKIYDHVNAMKNSAWHGQRYNELVVEFNSENVQNTISELLNVVIADIPKSLKVVASNIQRFETGSPGSEDVEASPELPRLVASTQEGMTFKESEVLSVRESIKENFTTASNKTNEVEEIMNQLKWESEAATNYKNKMRALSEDIQAAFMKLDEIYGIKMDETIRDIRSLEESNNVGA